MSNLDIARAVMAEKATKAKVEARGWKWARGVVLFPDIRCPYCKEGVRTPAIWKHTDFELVGQVIPVEGKVPVLEAPRHAHLLDSGQICFGAATTAYQALFGALNGKQNYRWRVVPFLQSDLMGFHSCAGVTAEPVVEDDEDEDTVLCTRCEDQFNGDDIYWFNVDAYCGDCYNEVAFDCWHCGEAGAIDEKHTGADDYGYCGPCWNARFFKCDDCDGVGNKDVAFTSASDERICEDCYNNNYFACSHCNETTANADRAAYEYDGDALCNYCFGEHYAKCETCDEVYANKDGHKDCPETADWRESILSDAEDVLLEAIEKLPVEGVPLPKGTTRAKRELIAANRALLRRVYKHLHQRYLDAPAETE